MAERRMRLKRGKVGDTGPRVTAPVMSGPDQWHANSVERSPFDEELIQRILTMLDPNPFESEEELAERAIRLTMTTMNMQKVLENKGAAPAGLVPPPPAPPPARTGRSIFGSNPFQRTAPQAEVHSVDVNIQRPMEWIRGMDGQSIPVSMGPAIVEITVIGNGDPVEMLREATETFHSDRTRIRTTT